MGILIAACVIFYLMNKSNDFFSIIQNAISMSRNEAFDILLGEDEQLKPYAFLNINEIKSEKEANLIIKHLTNHSNPIREACAISLLDMSGTKFLYNFTNIFIDAICDINPNICRAIIEFLTKNSIIANNALPLLIKKVNQILVEFKIYEKEFGAYKDNKMRNRKNHAKNKKLFNLYWCLEAISEIYNDTKYDDEIFKICFVTVEFIDYTIREKTAKILARIKNSPKELLQKLKNDKNFYVKNLVYDKICKDSDYRDNL